MSNGQLARHLSLQGGYRVSRATDPKEQEARAVATRVTRRGNKCGCDGHGCAKCGNRASNGSRPRKPATRLATSTSRGGVPGLGSGRPLDRRIRDDFEPAFGTDFSAVRVHTDDSSAALARSMNAKAFSTGHDIAFGPGRYDPHSGQGRRLIAHELAHVWQEQRRPDPGVIHRVDDETESGGEGEAAGGGEYDPCHVDVATLTNSQLLVEWQRARRYLDSTARGEDYYYDYANLMRRLSTERRSRMRGGHVWLAISSLNEVPGQLYEIESAGGLAARVVIADAEQEAGAPRRRSTSSVMTPGQFHELLERNNIPQIDVEEFYAQQRGEEVPEALEFLMPPPPPTAGSEVLTLESLFGLGAPGVPQDPLQMLLQPGLQAPFGPGGDYFGPYGSTMPHGGPAALAGLGGSGLHISPFDMYTRGNVLRQVYSQNVDLNNPQSVAGAELEWRGGFPEAAVEAGTYGDRIRMQPLNEVREDFRVFDTSMRSGPDVLISTTHSLPDPATGEIGFGHYRTKFRIMMGNTEGHKMTTAIADLNAHYGSSLTVQDVNNRNFLAVPDDHVQRVRADIEQAIGGPGARATSYSNLLDALLRSSPIEINGVTYSTWNQVQAARSNRQITVDEYRTLRQTLGQQAGQRVIGVGMSTPEIVEMQRTRVGTQQLSPTQFDILAPGEVLEMRRLMAQGMDEPSARSAVARGSMRRGAAVGGVGSAGINAVQLLMDPNDPRAWLRAGIDVPLSAVGGAGEVWAESQLNMRLAQPLLNRASAPGVSVGTSRLLTGAGLFGRTAIAGGVSAIAAPAITLASMGIEDAFTDTDYTRIDYAAAGGRTGVSAGVAGGGGFLATVGVTTLAGSEVPVLGNAIGFLVGVGLYFLTDYAVGDEVESGIREMGGEQGCVGGSMGNTWSSSSTPTPTRSPWDNPNKVCCFPAATPVRTERGYKPISRVRAGERVWCAASRDAGAGYREVAARQSHYGCFPLLELDVDGDRILVTERHWFETPHGWIASDELEAGMRLIGSAGARRIDGIRRTTASAPAVFNLQVEGGAYAVNEAGWVVRDH